MRGGSKAACVRPAAGAIAGRSNLRYLGRDTNDMRISPRRRPTLRGAIVLEREPDRSGCPARWKIDD
jgi:hypothetical protein